MSRVEQKESVLVCLDDEKGKPIALGEHPLRGTLSEESWGAIEETRNQDPSKDTLAAFENYSKYIRSWHQDTFVPERRRELFSAFLDDDDSNDEKSCIYNHRNPVV